MTETSEQLRAGMARQVEAYHGALAEGMPRLGWKVGINDPAAQQRLGLTGIIVGWMDGRRLIPAGGEYAPPAGARPRVEAETAILLGADVGPGATAAEARSAIAAVSPAIEFVNTAKPLAPIEELLANDILHDAVMLGSSMKAEAAAGLVATGFPVAKLNGEVARVGLPGRYPDDLAEIVAHVAAVLGANGETLRAGDWIIGGSYIDPFDIAGGDAVEVEFGPLGRLAFTVA